MESHAAPAESPKELAAPALTALVVLAGAGLAWVVTIAQSRSMAEMTMGLGSFDSFAITWVGMMAAMMLPSALPLVSGFAQSFERRRGWQAATGVLVVTYLSVWLAFGVIGYLLYNVFSMPWPNQRLVTGVALVLAGVYSLTPLKRANEARCRELCALHGPLPFNVFRSAVVAGAKYGIRCLGCTAALMVAAVLIGMTSLGWMGILSVLVLVSKSASSPTTLRTVIVSAVLAALGVVYAVAA
jgi:predicted metal-binding membrane protein